VLQGSFLSCLATVLELRERELPELPDEEPVGPFVTRWLASLGLGLVPIDDPVGFTWPGPWLARVTPPGGSERFVVMFGVPSGVVWDPGEGGQMDPQWRTAGYVVAAADISLARPARPDPPTGAGIVEQIAVAGHAGSAVEHPDSVRAMPGRGLEGDRHVTGRGTFPSGQAGSALTLIEAEVCEAFEPPLHADQHRRNLVVRGLELNRLVGHEFTIGAVRCRGMRLCEPCTVMEGYVGRPVLRELVHRGGLRADILSEAMISVGDRIEAVLQAPA
jgi:hypothetical protein